VEDHGSVMGGRDRKREEHPSHEGLPLPEKLPTWLSREKGWRITRRPSGVGCSGDDREEAGMSEIARRLLRALVDEAMAEKQAEAAEDVVGASAGVTPAVVAAARLPTGRHYGDVLSAALGELIGREALVYDYETSYLMAGRPGSPEAYKITQRGIQLLRETEAGE
jgi:hypothetical protein